jgi:hypothetical protein
MAPHGRHARERPAMADKRRLYSVTLAGDDPMFLQTALNEIAEEGGRVISVTWQPSRTVTRAGIGLSRFWIYDSVGALITMPKGPRGEKRPADVIGAAVVVAEALQD